MIRKLLLLVLILAIGNGPLQAQNIDIELDYQSFRPFVHFQLDIGTGGNYHDPFYRAYLKGYMDGVNDHYYYRHRFRQLVHDAQIYEAGYRDGFRDRSLLIRLRGRQWYHRHRFGHDDYYAPAYSVRIWLSGLSLAFLQAPERRLPRRWRRRAHPRFKKYRHWMRKHRRHRHNDHDDYDDDDHEDYDYDDEGRRYFASLERRYRERVERYRREARRIKRRHRRRDSDEDDHNRYDYRKRRSNESDGRSGWINRSKRSSRGIDRQSRQHRRSRGKVKRGRSHKKERNASRGRSRSRGRDR